MSSLSQSRWAPAPNCNNSRPSDRGNLLSPSEELSRFHKIVARLRWKLPFLAEGYRLATLSDPSIDNEAAEIMFKLDFHEYYALLERAIVHLLGVFGVSVASGAGVRNVGARWEKEHRYHANVLDALQAKTCPLQPVLGSGERLVQLKRAKELRNRWKTADLSAEEKARDDFRSGRRPDLVLPLHSYDLEIIIPEIFNGLEEGYTMAEAYAAQHDAPRNGQIASNMDWDFIVDAMDWEAV
ncbi:uncharacterized protein BDV14DRAFT_149188 [Aspergillus stella-maris]|uniref:uncharacterized protein n=1 Tax=Aspergillus stella-maris TaxID=1810926 RepID=UPI003CCD0D3A